MHNFLEARVTTAGNTFFLLTFWI